MDYQSCYQLVTQRDDALNGKVYKDLALSGGWISLRACAGLEKKCVEELCLHAQMLWHCDQARGKKKIEFHRLFSSSVAV